MTPEVTSSDLPSVKSASRFTLSPPTMSTLSLTSWMCPEQKGLSVIGKYCHVLLFRL